MSSRAFAPWACTLIAAATLVACGGGGGGSASAPGTPGVTQPAPPSAPTRQAEAVVLSGVSIQATDILVQTSGDTALLASAAAFMKRMAFNALGALAPDALAADTGKVDPGSNFGFTNKVKDGKLVSVSVKLTTTDGKATACSTDTAEVKIDRLWVTNKNKGHLMAKITAPATVNADCTVSYAAPTIYGINATTGATTDLTVAGDQVVAVVPANEDGFNSSSSNLLYYQSGMLRLLEVSDTGAAKLTDLIAPTVPVSTGAGSTAGILGQFAYDGRYLVIIPKDAFRGVLAFEKGAQGFKIIPNIRTTSPFQSVGIDPDGKLFYLVFDDNQGVPQTVDVAAGTIADTYTYRVVNLGPAAPGEAPCLLPEGCAYRQQLVNGVWTTIEAIAAASQSSSYSGYGRPTSSYSVNGRSGDWMMVRDCELWNMKTWQWIKPMHLVKPAGMTHLSSDYQYTIYTHLRQGRATCVNQLGNAVVSLDVNSGKATKFDLYVMGFFPQGLQPTDLFTSDGTMMMRIVDSRTADARFVEFNLVDGTWVDRGLIQSGNRKAVSLVPMGS